MIPLGAEISVSLQHYIDEARVSLLLYLGQTAPMPFDLLRVFVLVLSALIWLQATSNPESAAPRPDDQRDNDMNISFINGTGITRILGKVRNSQAFTAIRHGY